MKRFLFVSIFVLEALSGITDFSIVRASLTLEGIEANNVFNGNTSFIIMLRTKNVEKDGFLWYKIKKDNNYGAQDQKGQSIIPPIFSDIQYCYSEGMRYFKVRKENDYGVYAVGGKCIISPEKKYSEFKLHLYTDTMVYNNAYNGKYKPNRAYWIVKMNGKEGVLDANGNLVIEPKYYYIRMERGNYDTYCWTEKDAAEYFCTYEDSNLDGNSQGITNLDGVVVVPNGYNLCKIDKDKEGYCIWKLKKHQRSAFYDWSESERIRNGSITKYNYVEPSKYDYNPAIYTMMNSPGTSVYGDSEKSVYYVTMEGGKLVLNKPDGNKLTFSSNYQDISAAGGNFLRVKDNSGAGIISLEGKEIIPTSRGYTFIDNYNSTNKTFAFKKIGFSGVCNVLGQEVSTKKLPLTSNEVKQRGGYYSVAEIANGNTKYYKVSKNGKYGLTNSDGKEIVPVEMEALESAGTGYLRYKLNGFWGLMNYQGKILIDTNRGYTFIGDYKSFNKRFAYTMSGYKGECDATGRQISKIKVDTPQQAVVSNSSSSSSSSSRSSSANSGSNSGNKTTTVVVEHHRDPVPVQEWHACIGCGGMGTMGCDFCGGSGTKYIGDRLHRCSRCNGRGIIPCNVCYGNKGQYVTVYK